MRLKTSVTAVEVLLVIFVCVLYICDVIKPGLLRLSTEETIPFGLCVWSTGVAPAPIVRSLPLKHARNGRLLTVREAVFTVFISSEGYVSSYANRR